VNLPPLTERYPEVPADRLLTGFVPPRHFAGASFDTFHPDAAHPSQEAARRRVRGWARPTCSRRSRTPWGRSVVGRLYDREVPVVLDGRGAASIFSDAMLRGGYRKKYFGALSRLGALAGQGAELTS